MLLKPIFLCYHNFLCCSDKNDSMRIITTLLFIIFLALGVRGNSSIEKLKYDLRRIKNDSSRVSQYVKLSDAYRDVNSTKALDFANRANYISTKKKLPYIYIAQSLLQVAICQTDIYKLDSAFLNCNTALNIYMKHRHNVGIVKALNCQGRIYYSKANYSNALSSYNKALKVAQRFSNSKDLSLLYNNIGMVYMQIDDTDKAYIFIKKSIYVDSISKNKDAVEKGYVNLGMVFEQIAEYPKALSCYAKAYDISVELNNKRDMSKILSNIGNIYLSTKDYKNALKLFNKSILVKEKIGDAQGVANVYNNISVIYFSTKDYDSSLFYMNKALVVYKQLNDLQSVGRSYGNLGSIYVCLGDKIRAVDYISKGYKIRKSIGDIEGMSRSFFTLGELYYDDNVAYSILNFKKSLHLSKIAKLAKLETECYLKLSGLYEKLNKFSTSLAYYKLYHNNNDSIFNSKNQKMLLDLQTKYDTRFKDNELRISNKNAQIYKLNFEKSKIQVEYQKKIKCVFIIFFLLSFIIGIVYYLLFRYNKKRNLLLMSKNIEIETQKQEIYEQHKCLEKLNIELEQQKVLISLQNEKIRKELEHSLYASEVLYRENIQLRFDFLKNQLNPHFLFNTFSTLVSLISYKQDVAIKFTRSLSNVYRYMLSGNEKGLSRLHEEIEFANSYLFLISIRFDSNVRILFDINEADKSCYLPFLSLQLLIENAIKHNVISKSNPLTIEVKSADGEIVVTNNLQKKSYVEYSTNVGLNNIVNRYELLCSEKVCIIESSTHFTVRLPLIKSQISSEIYPLVN